MTHVKSGSVELHLGRIFKSWQPFHCSIVSNMLEFRKNASDATPFKRISINNTSIWVDEDTFHSERAVIIYHPLRKSVFLRLKDASERDEWITALQFATNAYSVKDARDDEYTSSDDENNNTCSFSSGNSAKAKSAPRSRDEVVAGNSEKAGSVSKSDLEKLEEDVLVILRDIHLRKVQGEDEKKVLTEAQHRLRDVCAPGERCVAVQDYSIVADFARQVLGVSEERDVLDVTERLVAHGNKELVQRFREALERSKQQES